ncbi:MAG: twin-arginine translocase TatA/TatE family subunit [Actinobacteria bacterium]|nr:twin-arginine translocase TatA/TatE family subunit [Actinomycetota bacterium]
MPSIGPEWLVVLGIVVLLFGAKKLPELARSMGKASGEFKKGLKEGTTAEDEPAAPAAQAPAVQAPAVQAPAPATPVEPTAPVQPPSSQPGDQASGG